MATSISRRLVYVKMKNKRPRRKEQAASPKDDILVGDTEPVSPTPARVLPPRPLPPAPRTRIWPWLLGTAVCAALLFAAYELSDPGETSGGSQVRRANRDADTDAAQDAARSPAYYGGLVEGSAGGDYTKQPYIPQEGFLSAPFPKHRKKVSETACPDNVVLTKDNISAFDKCLHDTE